MPSPDPPRTLFQLGRTVATQGAVQEVAEAEMLKALRRHERGDWGNVCAEDKAANDEALKAESRLLSSYTTSTGVTFWIITEWDRSVTTVLLPSEY